MPENRIPEKPASRHGVATALEMPSPETRRSAVYPGLAVAENAKNHRKTVPVQESMVPPGGLPATVPLPFVMKNGESFPARPIIPPKTFPMRPCPAFRHAGFTAHRIKAVNGTSPVPQLSPGCTILILGTIRLKIMNAVR